MPYVPQASVRNRLLAALSPADYEIIGPSLDPVELPRGHVLIDPDQRCDYAYFPEGGLVSIVAAMSHGQKLEIGIYGRDGFGPTSLPLGADQTPYQHLIQVEGSGFRISRRALLDAIEECPSLRKHLLHYCEFAAIQAGFTALSNSSGLIGERLARWLLMYHDRVDGDDLALTHDFLSVMLGVRRSSVTDAIHVLEGDLIIKATRANIRIRDRERLEQTAGDNYGPVEAAYERLIGPLRARSESLT